MHKEQGGGEDVIEVLRQEAQSKQKRERNQ